MQIFRTIAWVLLLVVLVAFTALNWRPVEVKIWESLIIETKIPALVICAFLAGLIPMWLIHRGSKWRNQVRIATLESAVRSTARSTTPPPASSPAQPANPVETESATKP